MIGQLNFQAGLGDETESAVNAALEAGYRHIDTAFVYRNEAVIGKVLNEWISMGKLKREDIFITTKLPPECQNGDLVEDYLKQSLESLQIDYVDLYLIHSPRGMKRTESTREMIFFDTDHLSIWKVSFKHINRTVCLIRIEIVN